MNDRYKKFIESIPIPAILTTYDTKDPIILSANTLHERLTGYTCKELIGASPRLFKGQFTSIWSSYALKQSISDYHFFSGNITNYKKNRSSHEIVLTILGIVIDGTKYYVAIKQPICK